MKGLPRTSNLFWPLLLLFPAAVSTAALQDDEEVSAATPETLAALRMVRQLGGSAQQDRTAPGAPITSVTILGAKISDADLRRLGQLTQLKSLHCTGSAFPAQSLQHIATLRKLETLGLAGTSITDQSLKPLGQLVGLRFLYLGNTQITDPGLCHLGPLRQLRQLYLNHTRISNAGLTNISRLAHTCSN